MKRKLTVLLILGLMIISLTACKKNEEQQGPSAVKVGNNGAATTESVETNVGTETDEYTQKAEELDEELNDFRDEDKKEHVKVDNSAEMSIKGSWQDKNSVTDTFIFDKQDMFNGYINSKQLQGFYTTDNKSYIEITYVDLEEEQKAIEKEQKKQEKELEKQQKKQEKELKASNKEELEKQQEEFEKEQQKQQEEFEKEQQEQQKQQEKIQKLQEKLNSSLEEDEAAECYKELFLLQHDEKNCKTIKYEIKVEIQNEDSGKSVNMTMTKGDKKINLIKTYDIE